MPSLSKLKAKLAQGDLPESTVDALKLVVGAIEEHESDDDKSHADLQKQIDELREMITVDVKPQAQPPANPQAIGDKVVADLKAQAQASLPKFTGDK